MSADLFKAVHSILTQSAWLGNPLFWNILPSTLMSHAHQSVCTVTSMWRSLKVFENWHHSPPGCSIPKNKNKKKASCFWRFIFLGFIFWAVLSSQQYRAECTEFPRAPVPPPPSLLYCQPRSPVVHFYNSWNYPDTSLSLKVQVYMRVYFIPWFGTNVSWQVSTITVSYKSVSLVPIFLSPKSVSLLHLVILSPCSPHSGKQWSFYCLHTFVFSTMSHTWNHILHSLFILASFIQ